ncbi:hypothetical protein [Lactobacillus crispatus]|uniref:hypothetical protein n=1 Tax=Lactobacillus crispatus TaxID=47770 RepID=UPI00105F10E0|nr:hypothetical protein [Lactobacillus crispatus]MBG0720888.1 hypothetical protein [Lactobacillus crispatus]MBG0734622.1 hypothetical protein [Lactobacillus crispatus]MBG0736920.1 hypothetical protein [Lactobacillus crispatus]MBI1717031.1 hypothetical protein [Lactobacillus crispatus]MCT7680341.1 hypothetical protein [Lactobacillus crispatus]
MKDIVYTVEFCGTNSNQKANEYLQKGWQLLHVGTKLVNSGEPADYETAYVVGADQKRYDAYKKELAQQPEDEFDKPIIRY